MNLTNSAQTWLEKHSILPQSWDIPEDEKSRINNAPIGLAWTFTPASRLEFRLSPWIKEVQFLVVIDGSHLLSKLISPDEQVGIILHELGHVFNLPPDPYYMNQSLEEEMFADYYAHHCGYGHHFAEAMTKMQARGIYGFDSPEIAVRVNELKNEHGPTLRLNLPNLPAQAF